MPSTKFHILKIVKEDPWLEPAAADVFARYQRYKELLGHIERAIGSLSAFADAYQYFGITHDPVRKGWIYREWAPKAKALFLKGDFNKFRELLKEVGHAHNE